MARGKFDQLTLSLSAWGLNQQELWDKEEISKCRQTASGPDTVAGHTQSLAAPMFHFLEGGHPQAISLKISAGHRTSFCATRRKPASGQKCASYGNLHLAQTHKDRSPLTRPLAQFHNSLPTAHTNSSRFHSCSARWEKVRSQVQLL